jgi:cytochrome c biogenesis protein CcmG, thiol:disulfide interchange protein DsbE
LSMQQGNHMTEITNTTTRRGVPIWIQILILALLVGLLVVVGLGVERTQQGTVQPGEKAPDFSMALYSGYEHEGRTELKLSDLRGKVVVINFWASWCKPCEQEAAELQQAWQEYKESGQVVILGADYVDTPTEANVYLKKFGITYPNGPADAHPKFKLSQIFRIQGVPETFFIDREGVLRYVMIGPFTSVDDIKFQIEQLLP